jgi:type IV pilus assembly protein PilA
MEGRKVKQQRRVIMKALRSSKGFTLIELMIVVAIIGILAAIAIPNFLQYQMKSRQAEAKTNLGAIKTSEVAFQAERGCYLGVTAEGPTVAASTKTVSLVWPGTPAIGAINFCVTGGTFLGTFKDIGFVATGNTFYRYAVEGVATGATLPVVACTAGMQAGTMLAGAASTATDVGFTAAAASNLDGDASISVWGASNDYGSTDCRVGSF